MSMFKIFKSAINNHYYFYLKVAGNKVILSSEGYTCKYSCMEAINSIKAEASLDHRYERRNQNFDHYSFNLKTSRSEIICSSENYKTSERREYDIALVKTAAPQAAVLDYTV
ncbi:YegP family protein [Pararcticibacter amylolyticus]|uniref:DUF1508 domain-containing protein n=1 Tax=Pararcticibacter amylolyticus TaxID=2173175 RepID=A0A2U2PGQ0_9SPHI|nr:YegP family protein [Pararcticibacter amylolyticus]PWG80571.1 hypothetical protein DDR33_11090 [Pararcticibacter amylolyticus]